MICVCCKKIFEPIVLEEILVCPKCGETMENNLQQKFVQKPQKKRRKNSKHNKNNSTLSLF